MSNTLLRIRVQLFAGAAELAGERQITVCVSAVDQRTALVSQLRDALQEQFPRLEALTSRSRFAIGKRFADDSDSVCTDDEVVLIPPVSGG